MQVLYMKQVPVRIRNRRCYGSSVISNDSTAGTRQPLVFSGIPESVFLDFFDVEPLHVRLPEAEELDEVGAIHIAYKLSLDGMLPTHLLGDDLKVF